MSLDTFDAAARAVLLGLADAGVRSIAVAAIAAAIVVILRLKHPAARLRVWTLVLCVALFLPLAAWVLPEIAVPLPSIVLTPAETVTDARIASTFTVGSVEAGAATSSLSMPAILLLLYLLGVALLAGRAGRGWLAALRIEWNGRLIADADVVERLARQASNLGLDRPVRLLEADDLDVPVTTSVWRPAVVLPAEWRDWPAATLDAVLVHELSHVSRRDALTERLALAYRAVSWPNPLAWWLRRQLSDLAEEASDAAALSTGVEPARYAQILLDFFVVVRRRPRRVIWSTAMARGVHAERRVLRVLQWKGSRPMSLSKPVAALCGVAAVLLVTVASIVRPVPVSASVPAPPAALTAPAVQPSPVSALTAGGTDVQGVPPAPPTPPVPPAPPAPPTPPSNDVVGPPPPPTPRTSQEPPIPPAPPAPPASGQVPTSPAPPAPPAPPDLASLVPDDDFAKDAFAQKTPGLRLPVLIQQVHPKYTSDAMRAKIQGQVVTQVIVAADGSVEKARVILSLDRDLDEQALLAVRQWRFQAGVLDGRSVPVVVMVTLEFRLH